MSKKTIEEQVQELTTEQKNNMGKARKLLIVAYFILLGVLILFQVLLYIYNTKKYSKFDKIENEINKNEEEIDYQLERLKDTDSLIELSDLETELNDLFSENQRLIYEMDKITNSDKDDVIVVLCYIIIINVYITAVLFILKKYPYYSNKKYRYLKKTNQI